MSKPHFNRMVKDFKSMNLIIQLMLMWDILVANDLATKEDIIYSKSYFSRYYCVDLDTFHKWICVFCPEIWNNHYRRKRIFTDDEANVIFGKLGIITSKNMLLQDRKELMNEIYSDKFWKKSRRYEEIRLELEDRFPDDKVKLNKIPPKITLEILNEELEEFDGTISEKQDEFFRTRIHVVQSTISKFQQLSGHKEEVYLRYFRRWLFAKD